MRWLSHSQVSQYECCPWGWYASKILKLPQPPSEVFAFGRAVHAAMSSYWLGNKEWRKVLKANIGWEYENIDLTEPGFGKGVEKADILRRYERSGIGLIENLTNKIKKDFPNAKCITTERKYKKVGFVGIVDWQGILDTEYILDWKTANKPYNPTRVHEDDQLTCYAALSGIRHVGYGIMCRSDGSTQLLLSSRTNDEISTYWNKVDRIRREMDKANSFKPCEDYHCSWCSFQAQCPAKGDF